MFANHVAVGLEIQASATTLSRTRLQRRLLQLKLAKEISTRQIKLVHRGGNQNLYVLVPRLRRLRRGKFLPSDQKSRTGKRDAESTDSGRSSERWCKNRVRELVGKRDCENSQGFPNENIGEEHSHQTMEKSF